MLDCDHPIVWVSDSSALHWEIASSGTRCSCCKPVVLVTLGGCHLLDSLVACDSVEACKEIVWCSGEEIVRGTVLTPRGSQRATLLDHVCHWATSLVGRFLRCPSEDEVHHTPLSRRTIKCWSTQRGRSLVATKWTLGENHHVNFVLPVGLQVPNTSLFLHSYTCACVIALVTSFACVAY